MNIRRDIFNDIIKDTESVRAVAMSIFVKTRNRASAIPKFTYNKLHALTGLHHSTCRKYVKALLRLGLAKFTGKDKRTLVFTRLHSRHQRRNVNLSGILTDTFKNIVFSLYSMSVVEIQLRKEFAKQTIATANSGKARQAVKAKRKARRCGYVTDPMHGEIPYEDNGISLQSIGRRIKAGLQKVQKVIRFSVSNGFLVKHKNIIQRYYEQARLYFAFNPSGWTFASTHNLYKVMANTYTVGERLRASLPEGLVG